MKRQEQQILVSVSTIVYNHERFLRQCIEGVLNQQTNFAFEYLIHDDCSTDGSADIIREYAAKYPDVIKPVFETENQYSKGGPWGSAVWNYPRAKGKYIALCEGDDYWTDPLKLQKQVDFMESHPDYSVCFCDYRNYNIYTNQYLEPEYTRLMRERGEADGMDLDIDTMFRRWVTMPLTILFRADALDFNLVHQYKYYRDTHETYHLMLNGKCRLMNFVGAMHNMHNGGIATNLKITESIQIHINVSEELYLHNLDKDTKNNLISAYAWKLRYTRPLSLARVICATKIFNLNHNIWLYIKKYSKKK
ncbi:MAG: glycosyltransferase family 2 protein [Paludibacteraceae bacterium]|nr:glycosyltransferase family 2 protein [Paludibacteraceae bacterium]